MLASAPSVAGVASSAVPASTAVWFSAAVSNGSTPEPLHAAKTIPADAANAGIRLVLTGVTVDQMYLLGHGCLGNLHQSRRRERPA